MLEAEVMALSEVNGHNVAVKAMASRLKGLFIGRSESEKVTTGLEIADAEILCRVSEDEGCTAEDLNTFGYGEGEGGGYG